MAGKEKMTFAEAIKQVLATLDGPIVVKELVARVLEIHPSRAKDPAGPVRTKLTQLRGRQLVFLDRATVSPLRLVAPGIRFRIPLSGFEIARHALLFAVAFHGWLPGGFPLEDLILEDTRGGTLPLRGCEITRDIQGLLGDFTARDKAIDLSEWFPGQQLTPEHSLLATILSWEPKRIRLELEPPEARRLHEAEIEAQNRELADRLYELLDEEPGELIMPGMAIPSAYARFADPNAYPGDHWTQVVEQDLRMKYSGLLISYADHQSPFDLIQADMLGESLFDELPFTQAEAEQVFQFKVMMAENKRLWARIRIQGQQTLATLHEWILRSFEYVGQEGIAYFTKIVPRGRGRRKRQVSLGEVQAGERTKAGFLRIAGLGLAVGNQLEHEYMVGFGVLHLAELEAILPPESGVSYPQILEQR